MEIYYIMDSLECKSHFSRKVIMCDKSHIFHQNMIVQSMYTKMPNHNLAQLYLQLIGDKRVIWINLEFTSTSKSLQKSPYFHWSYYWPNVILPHVG